MTSTPSSPHLATGSCLCRAVTYTLHSLPLNAVLCHCLNCRKSSGAAFMTNAFYPASALHITQSSPQSKTITDAPTTVGNALKTFKDTTTVTGATVSRQFCGNCGSCLFAWNSLHEGMVIVMSGTVDEGGEIGDEDLRPKVELFCKDRRGWMSGGDGKRERRDVL